MHVVCVYLSAVLYPPVSGGHFSLFGVTRGDRKNGRETDSQKTRNGELVTYVNETAEITVGHEDVVDTT